MPVMQTHVMTSLEITQDNVRDNTSSQINRLIDREIEASINSYKSRSKESIRARIEELDKEWDIERTLELNASVIAFSGIILSAAVSKKWLFLPAVVTFFLAQHAIQGWCPPLFVFRKMKIRTRKEIDKEKCGLTALLDKQ